ncbi:MAG: hypothetical protein LBN38_02960 [Verrucomicrobiota bacterium]|nr:hypothetical protein [Verrucomicrobiota bacterium]
MPHYYANGLAVSAGYTEAMQCPYENSLTGGLFRFVWAILVVFAIAVFSLYFALKKNSRNAFVLLIILPIMLVAFKEGNVRADALHFNVMFAQFFPITLFLCATFADNISHRKANTLLCVFILAIPVVSMPLRHREHFLQPVRQLLSPSLIHNHRESGMEELRGYYSNLPVRMIDSIGNSTVDIIPWDISLLYAYNLNWSPRPVMQSYSAYTETLDKMNAAHFQDDNAPEFVLYSFRSIDGRYPLFDEPSVFRSLTENYSVIDTSTNFLLLRRTTTISPTYCTLDSGTSEFGKAIPVPKTDNERLYCSVNIKMSVIGRLFNVAYKTGNIQLQIYVHNDSDPHQYRFIPQVGSNGIFLSAYADGITDVTRVFNGTYTQNIDSIRFTADHSAFYEKAIQYRFYAAPINAENDNVQ